MKDRITFTLGAALVGSCLALGICLALPEATIPDGAPVAPDAAPLVRPHVSEPMPSHRSYQSYEALLAKWQQEAPEHVAVSHYGSDPQCQPVVMRLYRKGSQGIPLLLHAAIHGNEPLSTSMVMSYAGRLLNEAPEVLDTYDLWIVPAVSPKTFDRTREVNGRDPNRDFDSRQPVPPVAAIKELFAAVHPRAVLSAHTHSQLFMTPYGSTRQPCEDDDAYADLFGRMAKLASYRHIRGYQMYGREIYGSEMDHYHRQGACACVVEYGTHHGPHTLPEIKSEHDRTWGAFQLWLQESHKLRRSQRLRLSLEVMR